MTRRKDIYEDDLISAREENKQLKELNTELLEACKAIQKAIDSGKDIGTKVWGDAHLQIFAAISKATKEC